MVLMKGRTERCEVVYTNAVINLPASELTTYCREHHPNVVPYLGDEGTNYRIYTDVAAPKQQEIGSAV